MRPLFSVIIPTFNYGRFLRRAIDSVLQQEDRNTEVIVIDDGSIDDTPVLVGSYGPRITSLRQENRGVFAACCAGVVRSAGRFVLFLDADDRLTEGAMATLRQAVARAPSAGIVAGRHATVTAGGLRPSPPMVGGSSRIDAFQRFLSGRLELCTGAAVICRDAVLPLVHREGSPRVGMETALIAHALWHYDLTVVEEVLLEVHEHAGRLRDNLEEIELAGERLVDAVFDARLLPPEAFRWREPYRGRLLRDRARSFHRAGRHGDAVAYFQRAMRSDPLGSLADLRNTRRYVSSRLQLARTEQPLPKPLRNRSPGVIELDGGSVLYGHRRLMQRDPINFLSRCAAFGDVVKLSLQRPTYLLSSPADIQHVFASDGASYRRTGLQASFPGLFGTGLFARTGRSHMKFRRPVQPLFHRGRLDGFLQVIYRAVVETLPAWHIGPVVDASQGMQELTIRVAARLILGTEDLSEAATLFEDIHASHQRVVRNRGGAVPMPGWLPTRRNRVLAAHVTRMHATIARLIERHRHQSPDDTVLSRLVHLRDATGQGYRHDEIRDHVLLIFLATYEPTATALAWTFDLLARHPEEQRSVREEIDRLGPDRQVAADILQRPVTAAVVHEVLRLHPSVWLLSRRTIRPVQLPSGAHVPRGADIAASIHHVHRDPRWYDKPAEFRPARFRDRVTTGRAAGTYLPFGLGPSACLGEYLARLVMAITIEQVLLRYELSPGPGSTPRPISVNGFTAQPERAVRLAVSRRSSSQ
jgi:cytochrome P450